MAVISAPELLTAAHDLSTFDCGNDVLNDWLIKRAMKNQTSGASRTFVVTSSTTAVGYYCLAAGSVERSLATKSLARNMPEPIPVMVLGRLAVDRTYQSKKLGSALLKDALLRVKRVSSDVGVRALLVHAISDNAKQFYKQFGFQESPMDDMTLMLSMKHL